MQVRERKALPDVSKVVKKNGIARVAYKAFLEFYRKESLSGEAPVEDIKFSWCKFGIEYWCGLDAFEEEPSKYRIIIWYPSKGCGETYTLIPLENLEGYRMKPIKLSDEQVRLVDRLVREDIVSRILMAVKKHILVDEEHRNLNLAWRFNLKEK